MWNGVKYYIPTWLTPEKLNIHDGRMRAVSLGNYDLLVAVGVSITSVY